MDTDGDKCLSLQSQAEGECCLWVQVANCVIIPETIEETLSCCFPWRKKTKQKTVMSFQNSMVCSQSSSGEMKRCQVFDEIQSNALKQTFWQFIPVKPKVMFPFVLKKHYQHWHLSYNSHATACLFASRAWNGVSFKERSALIWQSQTCFKSGTR